MAEVLLDSNIIAGYLDPDHMTHNQVRGALRALTRSGDSLCFVPQVAFELHNFLTRPRGDHGVGLTVVETARRLDQIEQVFSLRFPEPETEYRIFRELALELEPKGKKVHDLRLVASARALGINRFLTMDVADFKRAAEAGHIELLTPIDVPGFGGD